MNEMCKVVAISWMLWACLFFQSFAQNNFCFRVYFTDKPEIENQQPALSQKSLLRRQKFDIAIDSTDYPVSELYCQQIKMAGYSIVATSRWMNTVVVSLADSSTIHTVRRLPFVKDVCLVWKASTIIPLDTISRKTSQRSVALQTANQQINMLGVNRMHQEGFKGNGMTIAVIDGGFMGVDTLACFKNIRIEETRNMVYPQQSVYKKSSHGTMVLSTMACCSDFFMGTAPEASYCLLCSEDVDSEYPIEEDYWAQAAEFADSLGVDIINTSLGYTLFDDASMNHQYSQLDGKTAFISLAAEIAAQKGMILVNSAGNEGNNVWRRISFPADAPSVLTVGAVCVDSTRSLFSSYGPTADGRIKPDVMALGSAVFVYDERGTCRKASGTSFSSSLIAGMVACLWQSMPSLKPQALIDLIRENAHCASRPDSLNGYGIPNAYKIWLSSGMELAEKSQVEVYPNPVSEMLDISIHETIFHAALNVYDLSGRLCLRKELFEQTSQCSMEQLSPAVYVIEIVNNGCLCWRGRILKSE